MTLAPESVTAIDIALEPDQAMAARAQAENAALLRDFLRGFELDATHHPYVSVFAAFVPTVDLPKVYSIAGDVLAKEEYTSWHLTAFKYYYVPMGPVGLAGIVVRPTPDLLRLQQKLMEAVSPHTVSTATADAFYTTPEEPDIHRSVIDYTAASSVNNIGERFSSHVTIGIGTTATLDAMLAKPFAEFTFSSASASVYQFGDFGAARRL